MPIGALPIGEFVHVGQLLGIDRSTVLQPGAVHRGPDTADQAFLDTGQSRWLRFDQLDIDRLARLVHAEDSGDFSAQKTVRGITGIELTSQTAKVKDGKVTEYHATCKIAFTVE